MFRTVALLAGLFFLTACTGSAYKLPNVTHADIQASQEKFSKSAKPLKTYTRSDAQYRSTLSGISSRLIRSAKPLCEHSGYHKCHFQIIYKPDDTANAYASEGHKITLYKGLLQYLQTNDEIAAVIAHEMGHHLAKHNEEKMRNAVAGAAVSGIVTAIIMGAANSNNTYYTAQQRYQDEKTLENMMQIGAHLGALSYSKEQEREADLLATYLLSHAGYNLSKAQNVMVVLAQFAGETDPKRAAFLNSHPAGMERVAAWEKAMQEIKNNPSKLPYLKAKPKPAKSE